MTTPAGTGQFSASSSRTRKQARRPGSSSARRGRSNRRVAGPGMQALDAAVLVAVAALGEAVAGLTEAAVVGAAALVLVALPRTAAGLATSGVALGPRAGVFTTSF